MTTQTIAPHFDPTADDAPSDFVEIIVFLLCKIRLRSQCFVGMYWGQRPINIIPSANSSGVSDNRIGEVTFNRCSSMYAMDLSNKIDFRTRMKQTDKLHLIPAGQSPVVEKYLQSFAVRTISQN